LRLFKSFDSREYLLLLADLPLVFEKTETHAYELAGHARRVGFEATAYYPLGKVL
jgi:hypothetical protein